MRVAPPVGLLALLARWRATNETAQAVLLVIAGSFGFAIMGGIAKHLGDELNSFQIAFFRAFVGFILLAPMVMRAGVSSLKTSVPHLHLIRVIMGTCAMMTGFYALTHLPLATATAVAFTKPLFMIPVAIVLLGETVRWRRWSATIVGFIGVLIMVRPDSEGFDPGMLVALTQGLFIALAMGTMKMIPRTETERTILFYFAVFSTVITAIPASFVWVWPSPIQLTLLFAMGTIGIGSQAMTVRGFRIGEATIMSPLEYTRLIFATVVGLMFFGEQPTLGLLVGGLIVVGSTLYITRREAELGKPRKMPASVPH